MIIEVRDTEREKDLKEGSLLYTIVADWNESNIYEKASSRMVTVDIIVEYYWVGNPRILVFSEDGSVDHEASVEDPVPCEAPRKFLIYVSLSYHRSLFAKVRIH